MMQNIKSMCVMVYWLRLLGMFRHVLWPVYLLN